MPKHKTKSIHFTGDTRLWIEDNKIQIALSGGGLSGSHCATVKADGVMGKALSEHIYTNLLALIPGTVLINADQVDYARGEDRPRFSIERTRSALATMDQRNREEVTVRWHRRLNPQTVAADIGIVRAVLAVMGWTDLRIEVGSTDHRDTSHLRALLSLTLHNGSFCTLNGIWLTPAVAAGELVMVGDLNGAQGFGEDDLVQILNRVQIDLVRLGIPVLLDTSEFSLAQFQRALGLLAQSAEYRTGMQLIHRSSKHVQHWDGRYAKSLITATAVQDGSVLTLSEVIEETTTGASGPAGWHDIESLIEACTHLSAPAHDFTGVQLAKGKDPLTRTPGSSTQDQVAQILAQSAGKSPQEISQLLATANLLA